MTRGQETVRLAALARALQREVDELVPPTSAIETAEPASDQAAFYDTLIGDAGLRAATRALFLNGHFASAVEEAYKYVNNVVKSKSGQHHLDGSPLMESAFGPTSRRLRFNALKTASQRDQQIGYMKIFAGCVTGIRNPRAHEHAYLDQPDVALELLVLANHLMRMVNAATRTRIRKASTGP